MTGQLTLRTFILLMHYYELFLEANICTHSVNSPCPLVKFSFPQFNTNCSGSFVQFFMCLYSTSFIHPSIHSPIIYDIPSIICHSSIHHISSVHPVIYINQSIHSSVTDHVSSVIWTDVFRSINIHIMPLNTTVKANWSRLTI